MGSSPSNLLSKDNRTKSNEKQKENAKSRSKASNELDDAAGAGGRAAVKRGDSLNARANMIREGALQTAEDMDNALNQKYDGPLVKDAKVAKTHAKKKEKERLAQEESAAADRDVKEMWRQRVHTAMAKAHKVISTVALLESSQNEVKYQGPYQLLHKLPANMSDVVATDRQEFRKEWVALDAALRDVVKEMRFKAAVDKEERAVIAKAESDLRHKFEGEFQEIQKEMEEGQISHRAEDDRVVFDRLTAPIGSGKLPPIIKKQPLKAKPPAKSRRRLTHKKKQDDEPRHSVGGTPKEPEISASELDHASSIVEEYYRLTESVQRDRIEVDSLSPAEQKAVHHFGLLTAFLNRQNHKSIEGADWSLPERVTSKGRLQFDAAQEAFKIKAKEALQAGEFAVHIDAVAPVAPGSFDGDIQAPPLFLVDPWDLKVGLEDEGVSLVGEHISGLCMGGRMLLQMQRAVSSLGGLEALKKIIVVIHVGTWFEKAVVDNLVAGGFYGFPREHVVIVSQPRFYGYSWEDANSAFAEHTTVDCVSMGSGYSFKQLTWAGEAKVIEEDGSATALEDSCTDFLINCGIKYLQCSQVEDAFRYTKEGALDFDVFATFLRRHSEYKNNLLVETRGGNPTYADHLRLGVALRELKETMTDNEKVSSCILKPESLRTADMTTVFKKLINEAEETQYFLSTGRSIMFLPIVKKALVDDHLRPTLSLRARHVFPQIHFADFTRHPGVNMVAVDGGGSAEDPIHGRGGSHSVANQREVFHLLQQVILPMDKDPEFQRALSNAHSGDAKGGSIMMAVGEMARFKATVCVINDAASKKAFTIAENLLRAGVDRLHTVMVATSATEVPRGQKVLDLFQPDDKLLELVRDVRPADNFGGGNPVVAAIENYVTDVGSNLVIFGSETLTKENPVGSIAMMAIKSLPQNILVCKRNVNWAPPPAPGQKDKPRNFMVWANHHDSYTLDLALDFLRPSVDTLTLLHISVQEGDAAKVEAVQGERILGRMETSAVRRGVRPKKVLLSNKNPGRAIVNQARDSKIDMIVIRDPFRSKMVNPVVNDVLAATSSLVLLHRPE